MALTTAAHSHPLHECHVQEEERIFSSPNSHLYSIFDLVCYTLHMQSHMLKMQRVLGKPFLRLLIQLLLHIHAYRCCIEEERRGLIEIKAFLKSNNENANRLLPSWVEDEMSDCCGWERVGCDPSTGHVTELSLNDLRKNARLEMFRGYNEGHWQLYYEDDKFWLLNVSLFLSFKELRSLDLAANSFDGWTGDEGMFYFPPSISTTEWESQDAFQWFSQQFYFILLYVAIYF